MHYVGDTITTSPCLCFYVNLISSFTTRVRH